MQLGTYLWVEGVSPPFPSEHPTQAELSAFLLGCTPADRIVEALPKDDWEVVSFAWLDLHVVKIPYDGHTYARPYIQRNVLSNKLRLLITFPGYQSDHLRAVFRFVTITNGAKLYRQAVDIVINSTTILELQNKVEKAVLDLTGVLKQILSHVETVESSEATTCKPITAEKGIIGQTLKGVVVASATHVEIRLSSLDEDKLVELARSYVAEKKLGWNVRKPYVWTEQHTGPHVTIDSKFRGNAGDTVLVTLESIYHFVSESRWVAINVRLPAPYKCVYECHLSIGQERAPFKK